MTILSKIYFNSLLNTTTWALVWGWYTVATLWVPLYILRTLSNCTLQKCMPWSLMIALDVPKIGKLFLQQPINNFGVISGECFSFNPSRNIVDYNQDIFIPVWTRKRTLKVNMPNIKDFAVNNRILRHFKVIGDVTYPLTTVATLDVLLHIVKNGWPKGTCLKYFYRGLVGTIVSTCGSNVTLLHNLPFFLVRDALLNELICTNLKKMWVFPYIILHIHKKFLFEMWSYIFGKNPGNKIN